MGGSVAYVGVWPGSFKTVPMTGGGHAPFATSPVAISPAACSDCQPRPGSASVRNRSTMHRWCSSNAGRSDLTGGSDVKMYGDSADLLDEYFRSRLPLGRCTGGKGRETTECGATAVISTPPTMSRTGRERPGAPARCWGTCIEMYTLHLFKDRFPLYYATSVWKSTKERVSRDGQSRWRGDQNGGQGVMLANVFDRSQVGFTG